MVDCFFQPHGEGADFSSVEEAHTRIIDQVVEVDEALMEIYLEQGQDLDPDQLHDPFETALREGHLIPICFCSAETGAGIPELLDILARLMPNPSEGNPPPFLKGEGDDAERVGDQPRSREARPRPRLQDHQRPVPRQARHLPHAPGHGEARRAALIGDARKPFKVAHLFQLQGKEQIEVTAGRAGRHLRRAEDRRDPSSTRCCTTRTTRTTTT